jgi:O-antigen ligase
MNPIKKHLILGVGTGGVDTVMREEYKRIGNEKFLNERYNLHSQYLEVLLENGLIGLLIFMAMISAMVFTAFSQKNLLYGIYILTIMFFFLFETGLNRLPGVSFFSLFSLLLIFYSDKERISRTSVINSH